MSEADIMTNPDETDQPIGKRRNPDSYIEGKGFENFKARVMMLSCCEFMFGGVVIAAFITVMVALISWY